MKKKYFLCQYLLEGLILATAAMNYIPFTVFIPTFIILSAITYLKDGFQMSTLYYFPLALGLIIGRYIEFKHTDTIICIGVVLMQYVDSGVYELPANKRLAGYRKMTDQKGDYFEFYPLEDKPNPVQRSINWNQGQAMQKVIQLKQHQLSILLCRITLSYLDRMKMKVGQGVQKITKSGMAFFHGRDAAPLWYSSLFNHFTSNGFKVGARQHQNTKVLDIQDIDEVKKIRQQEVKSMSKQYYQTICKLNCEKIVLVGHSYGCSALLQTYFDNKTELQNKVTHIVLMDPYLFPLANSLLKTSIHCPILILANQYFLNIEDMHSRLTKFMTKPNIKCIIWKQGSFISQTDLTFFFNNGDKEFQSKFLMNFEAINYFMKEQEVEGAFGAYDLGRSYKPDTFLPNNLFSF